MVGWVEQLVDAAERHISVMQVSLSASPIFSLCPCSHTTGKMFLNCCSLCA